MIIATQRHPSPHQLQLQTQQCKFVSASQPAQPLSLSGTPASYTTQHYIPQPTRSPVTAANNEATSQPLLNTAAPLVSSFDPAQTIVDETQTVDSSQPATSSDII